MINIKRKEDLTMKKVIINTKAANLDEYRYLCEVACEAGATHLMVSQIEPSYWIWDEDRYDPYSNWSIYNATAFKFYVPDKLREFLPEDYAKRNIEMIAKRGDILKEFNLKAAFQGMDPAYLPERVYRKYPDWRGPRCDQARRSRKGYYAPCIDNPEVQEMFVEAFKKICEAAPVEYFKFLTNDSGGGFCWSDNLYPGKNGPSHCMHISSGDRIVSFLDLVQKGASLAGVEAEAGFSEFFKESEIASTAPKLKKGQFITSFTCDGNSVTREIGSRFVAQAHCTCPVPDFIPIVKFVKQAQQVKEDDTCNAVINMTSPNCVEVVTFLKKCYKTLSGGVANRITALNKSASEIVGDKYADKLVEAWEYINDGIELVSHIHCGGHILMLGTIHQRWLTRPFVAFPNELTADEKNYYREFQFQAQEEKNADDMLDLQASKWIAGHSGMMLIYLNFKHSKEYFYTAIDILNQLIETVEEEKAHDYLLILRDRIKMYICLLVNAENVVRFQTVIDATDYNEIPEDKTDIFYEQGDIRMVKVNNIIRSEIDNTLEIISLLMNSKAPLITTADSEQHETIMYFGPELIKDLQHKIEIMENHKYDFTRLYKSYNK